MTRPLRVVLDETLQAVEKAEDVAGGIWRGAERVEAAVRRYERAVERATAAANRFWLLLFLLSLLAGAVGALLMVAVFRLSTTP